MRINDNSISLIRIIAACQVMLGHIIEHLELPIDDTPLRLVYFIRGVPVFFVISGFLIWFSIERSQSYRQYLEKRFWRIYPELWVAVIIEIIILVMLYNGWELKELLLFAFGQGTIFQFYTPDSLRGYGVGTPNGALWTIGVMIQFYIIAWFVHKLMHKRKPTTWVAGFLAAFLISAGGTYITKHYLDIEIASKLYDQTFIKYFWLFYIGMFVAEYKTSAIPVLQKYWYVLLIAAFLFFWTGWDLFSGYFLLWSLFMTLGLIGFAYRFPRFAIAPDISYGLFLYHMIVVNVFVHYNIIGNWKYVIPVVVVSMLLAFISTVTIGKAAANYKAYKTIKNGRRIT